MKLTFLGTAAAEGMPALWCECPACAKAKKLGGKELRRRCSYLLDGDTLVDSGPDAFWQSIEFNSFSGTGPADLCVHPLRQKRPQRQRHRLARRRDVETP